MVIVQTLAAMIFGSLGKILNTAFGWATLLLFGKVPESRQIYLSAIAFASEVWIVSVIGTLLPGVGAFLLALVTLPEWLDPTWVRLGMLALALLLPLLVGTVGLLLVDPANRPQGQARLKATLKGYPFTVGLAVTLLLMLLVAPILKMRDLLRRWTSAHIPVVVESKDYLDVVGSIEDVLGKRGLPVNAGRASLLLRAPTKVFMLFAGGPLEDLVGDELTALRGHDFEVMLHPSDLIVRGRQARVTRIRMLLAEHLTFTKAHLTWSKEAHEIEETLERCWRRAISRPSDAQQEDNSLESIEQKLRRFNGPYEEWEVLFREKLLVECRLLERAAAAHEGTQLVS